MKNSIYILLLVTVSLSIATAQTERGRWTVGAQVGNVSYRSSNSGPLSSRNTTVLLAPSGGYFIANNVAVGASLPIYYGYYRSRYPTTSSFTPAEIKNTQIGLAPFIRAYIGSSKLRPFVNATVGFTQQWYSSTNFNTTNQVKNSDNFFTYGGAVGVAYFVNQNVSLDASLGYSGGEQRNTADLLNGATTLPGSFGLNVGFRLFLGR